MGYGLWVMGYVFIFLHCGDECDGDWRVDLERFGS